jgi:tol-pal system protein YbgF
MLCYAVAAITDTGVYSEAWGTVFGTRHAKNNIQRISTLPMKRTRLCMLSAFKSSAAVLAFTLLLPAGMAAAQDRDSSGNFLNNLFNRGEPQAQQRQAPQQAQAGRVAQSDPGDLTVRLDRIENALRQVTGTIEQLQYRNQQLEMQLKRMQDDTEYRFQQLGGRGSAPPPAQAAPTNPGSAPGGPPANPGRRSDIFDPSQHPNAPGAPRILGNQAAIAVPEQGRDNGPVGAPGGRAAGAPLDLSTLAGNNDAPRSPPPGAVASAGGAPVPAQQMPPPQVRNVAPTGQQLATLPPSATPKDEYDMAYGYVLHKDYSLAEQSFRDFLRKYPNEQLVPDANYWLGESLFQQQRYRDAAESFLNVSTKYERSGKAPDALLRLGQSLAAMNQKEAACATLAEVERKFPRASAGVKRGVAQEQKRAHC